jgi:protein SCO1
VDGGAVRGADLRGKAVLVTFLDTRCREACPIIAGQIASALRQLKPDERARVAAIAITVNPRVDTAPHVRAFLAEHRASGLIRYVTGSRAQLAPVWKAFHVLPAIETGNDDIHSADVRVFDTDTTWVSTLHTAVDLTPANLAHDVRLALSPAD